jgi:hypothetical protein
MAENNENPKKRKISDLDDSEVHQPFTKKMKISFDLETNLVLPQEIMLEIMEYLDPGDLKTFSEVCKYWLTCSLEMVGWTFVDAATANNWEFAGNYAKKIDALFPDRRPEAGEMQVQFLTRVMTIKLPTEENRQVGFLNDKGEVVCSVDRWCLTYKYRDSNSDIIHAYFSGFSDIARVNNCPGWRIDLHVARSTQVDLEKRSR